LRAQPGDGAYPLFVAISGEEVRAGQTGGTLKVLERLYETPSAAWQTAERLHLSFSGYDDTSTELADIDEVREYVRRLDERFPFWLYFCSKDSAGLTVITRCLLPPSLTPAGRRRVFPPAA
jgi:hypothetical protein